MPDVPRGDGAASLAPPQQPRLVPRAARAASRSATPPRICAREQRRAAAADQPEQDTPWKLIVFGVLAVYAILIVLFNRKQVEVSFVFFSARISLLVLILLCVGIGFAAGYLFEQLRDRRKRRHSQPRRRSERSTPSAIRSGVS